MHLDPLTTVVVLAVVAAVALSLVFWLGRPATQGVVVDGHDRMVLWGGVERTAAELRRSIEDNAEMACERVRETTEDFGGWIQAQAPERAEGAAQALDGLAVRKLEDTWFWERLDFDVTTFVRAELVPSLLEHYDRYRRDGLAHLRQLHEQRLGLPLEDALADPGLSLGDSPQAGPGALVVAAGAGTVAAGLGALAVFGGVTLAAPAAALVAAFAAAYSIRSYESSETLASAASREGRRLAARLFVGEGYRDPSDGSLVPSASSLLLRAAAGLEARLLRRLEAARAHNLRRIRANQAALRERWEAGQVSYSQLRDRSFVLAQLQPQPCKEVVHG